ncbi:RICIN domain-containing protein [Streptomyces cucumeris]|uniref:RICIN domain-containing protein n=1 Tax=Streptomyces cucumeris TaxID=2962890 RepID=UPI003EB6F07E
MSDQHQAGGSTTSSGLSAAGSATDGPESTSVRGEPPAVGETSAVGGTSAASDSSPQRSSGPRRTWTATGEPGEGDSAGGAVRMVRRGMSMSSGPATVATTEPDGGARTGRRPATPEARGGREEEAAAGEEPVTGPRSNGGIRAWASRIGLSASTAAFAETRAGEGAAVAATAAAPGHGSRDGDVGSPGRPKKPMLAGAAMAGVILIAVPLLVVATSQDEDDRKKVASSADTVLGDDGSKQGEFVAESPAAEETKDGKKRSAPSSEGEADSNPAGSGPPVGKEGEGGESGHQEGGKTAGEMDDGKAKPGTGGGKTGVGNGTHSHALPAVLSRTLIKNNANKTCVDIPGYGKGANGGRIIQAKCNNRTHDNQLWTAQKKSKGGGPGGAPLFVIRNVKAGKCLDLPGGGAAKKGEKVKEAPCQGATADNQLWWLDKRHDGRFWIRNAASHNMCLDSHAVKSKIRDLLISPCAPEKRNNHKWIFTRG